MKRLIRWRAAAAAAVAALWLAPGPATAEMAVATGQIARLVADGADGHELYLYPGMRLLTDGEAEGAAGDLRRYRTEVGGIVLADPSNILGPDALDELNRRAGPVVAFLLEPQLPRVTIGGAAWELALVPGTPHRVAWQRAKTVALAIDACDQLFERLRFCWAAETPRLMVPVELPRTEVGLLDVQAAAGAARRGSWSAPPAVAAIEETLARSCGGATAHSPAGAGPAVIRVATGEPDPAPAASELRRTRLVREDGSALTVEQIRPCTGEGPLRIAVRDTAGQTASLGRTAAPGGGRLAMSCTAPFWAMLNELLAQGLREPDAHVALAAIVDWPSLGPWTCQGS